MHTKFGSEHTKGRDYLEDIIVEWIHLAQDRDQWRALVNIKVDSNVFVE
jgi:hypothetical protein